MVRHYRIGEFAALGGASVKALRFYDAIGLLRPSSIDARTGYRNYSPAQLQQLAAIQELKSLGLSLSRIRVVIGRGVHATERRSLLREIKSDLQRSIRSASESLRWIDTELDELHELQPSAPVVLRRRRALPIASLKKKLRTYEEVFPLEEELLKSLPPQAVGKTRGVLWHRCADSGTLEAEPFVELRQRVSRGSRYDVRELPAASVACCYAPFEDDAEPAYAAIRRWMRAHRARLAGPKREVYLGQLLEIQFPLAAA